MAKLGIVVVHSCNPSPWGMEAVRSSRILSHFGLYTGFQHILDYRMRFCFKRQTKKSKINVEEQVQRQREAATTWMRELESIPITQSLLIYFLSTYMYTHS